MILNDLARDYIRSAECEILRRYHPGLTIENRGADDVLPVKASSTHLHKAVMNLVSNAAEALTGAARGGRVSVATGKRHLERPFYSKKVMGRSGAGLGLTVVWNTVKDHGGHIDIESSEAGTRFDVYLPITREPIPQKSPAASVEQHQGSGERILVVDDIESQRDIASRMLRVLGYEPEAVASGEEAVEVLKARPAHLVLLDMTTGLGSGCRGLPQEAPHLGADGLGRP